MDKIEARAKWLKANGKACKFQEADPECSLATFPECDKPVASEVIEIKSGHRLPRDDPDIALSKRARCDTHDTPPHKKALGVSDVVFAERTDSAIIPAARVNSPCPREVGHSPPCDDSGRVREEYEKGTIAGDDPKAFRDKYRFLPYRFLPYGTNLCNCLLYTSPSPRD